MRQTIGQTWIIQLVIVFILLFVGYIVLTLNYSRTVKLKNEITSIIEKYEGLNDYSIGLVNEYLSTNGYSASGYCGTSKTGMGVYGGTLDSEKLEEVKEDTKYNYCIRKYQGNNITNYYQITLFYKFNLPYLGNISGFTIKGSTNSFVAYDNEDYCNTVTGSCNEKIKNYCKVKTTDIYGVIYVSASSFTAKDKYTTSMSVNLRHSSGADMKVTTSGLVTGDYTTVYNYWKEHSGNDYNMTQGVTSKVDPGSAANLGTYSLKSNNVDVSVRYTKQEQDKWYFTVTLSYKNLKSIGTSAYNGSGYFVPYQFTVSYADKSECIRTSDSSKVQSGYKLVR